MSSASLPWPTGPRRSLSSLACCDGHLIASSECWPLAKNSVKINCYQNICLCFFNCPFCPYLSNGVLFQETNQFFHTPNKYKTCVEWETSWFLKLSKVSPKLIKTSFCWRKMIQRFSLFKIFKAFKLFLSWDFPVHNYQAIQSKCCLSSLKILDLESILVTSSAELLVLECHRRAWWWLKSLFYFSEIAIRNYSNYANLFSGNAIILKLVLACSP